MKLGKLPERLKLADPRRIQAASCDQTRQSSNARGYTSKWRTARLHWLRKHPLCVACQAEGRVTVATDLDHIVPHRGDMLRFWDRENWQGLCASHHSAKTAREDGGFGNRGAGG